MLQLKFIASVAERDIDLLITEELSVSDEFREWMAARVFGEPTFGSTLHALHSVTDAQLGESDVVFLFQSLDGARIGVLIENKIDAPPQRDQGQRYRLRGEKGIAQGDWDRFRTCVVAPQRYLESGKHTESYDAEISYEELLAYFQSRGPRDARYAYKAKVVLEAIQQNRRGYTPQISEAMTQFVADYVRMAAEQFPDLGVQSAKPRPAGSTWIIFVPVAAPKGVYLVHQLTAGFVKAIFPGQVAVVDRLKVALAKSLPSDAAIVPAGKSAAISISVPVIDPLEQSVLDQQDRILTALEWIAVLGDLAKKAEPHLAAKAGPGATAAVE